MRKLKKIGTNGRTALALAGIGVLIVGSGTAFSRGSAVPGSGGVKAEDIAAQAVNSKKIRDYNVGPKKLSRTYFRTASETVEAGTSEDVRATCGEDERMLSGGFGLSSDIDVRVIQSMPAGAENGWQALAHSYAGQNTTLTVYAICLA